MSNYDLDMSALQEEFARVSVSKKPGANKKTGTFLDKILKMPKGSGYVTVRLMPAIPGFAFPFAPCRVHNLATEEERQQKPTPRARNLYCGKTLENSKWVGDCFFCDYYYHLYKLADKAKLDGNDDLVKQYVKKATDIKPQEKYYYNGVVFDSGPPTGQTMEDGPLIYSCGVTIHNRILEACLGNTKMNKKSKGNIFHPENGRCLKIVKEMKPGGQFPDYSGTEWEDPTPLDEALFQKWMSSLNNVHEIRKVISVDEMKRAIRIYEGVEIDTRKAFDTSFLNEESENKQEAHEETPIIVSSRPTIVEEPSHIVVNNDPLVDDDFANSVADSVRAALGNV